MLSKENRVILTLFFILLLHPHITPSKSLDTGPIDLGSLPINLPIRINLNFWGYHDSFNFLSVSLDNLMPKTIVHQTTNPKNATPIQYKAYISGWNFAFKSDIEYSFTDRFSNDANVIDLLTEINDSTSQTTGNYVNSSGNIKIISGTRIDYNALDEYFQRFNIENGYSIHILNLSILDFNNTSHWIDLGLSNKESISLLDMRNLGISGNDSIFYDPTSFAPNFEDDKLDLDNTSITEIPTYLANRLTTIIEQIMIGSPYSMNYLAMQNKIHVAQILIGNKTTDRMYTNAINSLYQVPQSDEGLKTNMENLLPYFGIKTSFVKFVLHDYPSIANYLKSSEIDVNGTPTIIVTPKFSEDMKYMIRSQKNLYSEYPSRYYHAVLVMADSDTREYVYETDDGFVKYEAGELGLGILDLKDWNKLSNADQSRSYIFPLVQRIFGKMLGISELSGKLAKQIESPMSTFGLSPSWEFIFNPFEKDSLGKRFSALYNFTTIRKINSFRNELTDSLFSWLDRSSLDYAETTLIKANTLYYKGKFIEATRLYIEGYEQWLDAEKDIKEKIGAFYNTREFIGVLIILGAIVYLMRSFTISKQDFFNNINKKRKSILDDENSKIKKI